MEPRKSGPILVAMSGGVDSSVVAGLLKKQGYEVIGLTMQIWQESQRDPRHAGCCSLGAVEDARRVARILDIPHYVINFKDEFREAVIDQFIEEYSAGRTPNPCVECNRKVKFEVLLERMHALGCEKLATGHYARIKQDSETGNYQLHRSLGGKDQSYVLYMLGQEQMRHLMFPLGELPGKAETREMAREMGLPVANKPDSQEICFVSDAGGYREFLRKEKPEMFGPGEIVNSDGEVIGSHAGVADFTVGQRKGIKLANAGKPLFVLKVLPAANRVVVGDGDELLQSEVSLENLSWRCDTPGPIKVEAKIRYNMEAQPALLFGPGEPRLLFEEPVRAVTPGQIAVAYRGDEVVAGGVICAK